MQTSPLVSVVTPSFDPGGRLLRCLDSVAGQTYPHVEHIVVDGGSTDGTVELLRSRGVRFVSEPDRGQTHAINKGFGLAGGTLLGWLNTDDILMPGAVAAVVAAAADPSIGWIYGDCDVRRDGKRVLLWRPTPSMGPRTLDNGDVVPQPGSFIARWALERVGPLDEAFDLAMDYDLWLRLLDADVKATYVSETLAEFELHDASKSGTIHRSEFFVDEGLALLKSGRQRQAALAFGRAAAAAAQGDGVLINRTALEQTIGRFAVRAHDRYGSVDVRAVRAAAFAEAAVLELHRTPRGARHLLHREPWLYAETRARLVSAVRRGAGRLKR